MSRSTFLFVCVLALSGALHGLAPGANAQNQRADSTNGAPPTVVADTVSTNPSAPDTSVAPDTTEVDGPAGPSPDTTRADTTRADTTRTGPPRADTTGTPPAGPGGTPGSGGGVDRPVTLTSRDSLVISFSDEEGDVGTLFGDAEIEYEDATLKARVVEMDFERDQVKAYGRRQAAPDTSAPTPRPPKALRTQRAGNERIGNVIGRPQRTRAPADTVATQPPTFTQGADQSFTGEQLSFNLATSRGRVVSARTEAQQRAGFVTGRTVKVYEDSTLFIEDGSYTTCDCEPDETPSYSLRSDRMKVRGKWVYTGPIQMYLFEVPTPLWLPFGFLPNTRGRRSGPLPPEYGQDRRGLYLTNWGWYFAMNEYIDLTIQAGIWSQGSFEIKPRFRYDKRYRYNGSLRVEYLRERIGEAEDPNPVRTQQGRLQWGHSQTFSPTASLSGNVNLVTSGDYLENNATNVNDAIRRTINSSVQFNKQWPGGGRSVTVSVSQNQQLTSGQASVTLPSVDFTQSDFKPFASSTSIGEPSWYERIRVGYDMSFDNQYSFSPRDPETLRAEGDSAAADVQWYDAIFNPDLYRRATGRNEPPLDPEMSHSVRPTLSFRFPRLNLGLSPNISYNSDWFMYTKRVFQDLTVEDDPTTEDVEMDSTLTNVERNVPGFYARHEFQTGINANTEFFGVFPVRLGSFRGLLHRVSPTVGLSYRPNFNDPFWGQTRVLRNENGEPVRDPQTGDEVLYDIRSGRVVGRGTRSLSLSFGANNDFETKRVRVDSTGEEQEDRFKFLDVNVNSSYNFAADSLNLADFNVNARTTIADLVSARLSLTLSPYEYVNLAPEGERERIRTVNRYEAASTPWKPLRFTRLTLNLGADFESGDGGGVRSSPGRMPARGASGSPVRDPYAAYRTPTGYPRFETPWTLGLDLRYTLSKPGADADPTANVSLDGSLAVTPKWRVEGDTSFDIIERKLRQTTVGVSRDLGCWALSLGWAPFGNRQFYSFRLQVNQGMLSNLLRLDIPRGGDANIFRDIGQRAAQSAAGATGGGPAGF